MVWREDLVVFQVEHERVTEDSHSDVGEVAEARVVGKCDRIEQVYYSGHLFSFAPVRMMIIAR